MTELELIPDAPPSPADETDIFLRAQGLPFETRHTDGTRRCRHHPDQPILARGAPCQACIGERTQKPAGEGATT